MGMVWSVSHSSHQPWLSVPEGTCGPSLASVSDFYERSPSSHILVEILQICKCWPKKKKGISLYSSSQHLQVGFCQFSVMTVYISMLAFVTIDFASLFMSFSSLALGEWPCHTHSWVPSGWSNALHIEDT